MRDVTRPNEIAIIIAPDGGNGAKNVFLKEKDRLQAAYGIPDEHVILFDHDAKSTARYAYTCSEIDRVARSLPAGTKIRTVIILRHGGPRWGQEGVNTGNLGAMVDAFGQSLTEDCTVVFFSCSNAANIGKNPDGDMSLADEMRDQLADRGFVWCQTFGHLIAGHATYEIADRAGGKWRPLARWFRGNGTRGGQIGGEPVLPPGHELLPTLFGLIRKSVDPDMEDDGVEEKVPFRFMVPFMESQAELIAHLERLSDLPEKTDETAKAQAGLFKGGFLKVMPAEGHGLGRLGPLTKAATQKFQKEHGLKEDGIPGPITMRALKDAGLLD